MPDKNEDCDNPGEDSQLTLGKIDRYAFAGEPSSDEHAIAPDTTKAGMELGRSQETLMPLMGGEAMQSPRNSGRSQEARVLEAEP